MILSLLGCAQNTSKYYYVSLEGVDGIEVLKKSKVELKKLDKNSEIATEYLLSRDGYKLKFLIGNQSYYPHLNISVSDLNSSLSLKARRDYNVVSKKGGICASYYFNVERPLAMDFGWSVDCIAEDIEKVISFDVIDEFGSVIKSENVRFDINSDGEYTLVDAL